MCFPAPKCHNDAAGGRREEGKLCSDVRKASTSLFWLVKRSGFRVLCIEARSQDRKHLTMNNDEMIDDKGRPRSSDLAEIDPPAKARNFKRVLFSPLHVFPIIASC